MDLRCSIKQDVWGKQKDDFRNWGENCGDFAAKYSQLLVGS